MKLWLLYIGSTLLFISCYIREQCDSGYNDGVNLVYGEGGQIHRVIFAKDCYANGLQLEFYQSGKLQMQGNYTNGGPNGELYYYDEYDNWRVLQVYYGHGVLSRVEFTHFEPLWEVHAVVKRDSMLFFSSEPPFSATVAIESFGFDIEDMIVSFFDGEKIIAENGNLQNPRRVSVSDSIQRVEITR